MGGPRRSLLSGASYWMLAWSIPIAIFIGYGAGWLADERFGTEPCLQIVGFLLGAISGLVQLLRLADTNDE